MTFELLQGLLSTFAAGEDMSDGTRQYRFVKPGAAANLVLRAAAASDIILGVLQNDPKQNDAAEVVNLGITKVVAGAAVALFARVTSDATGRAITAAAGADTAVGIALAAAGAAGELIPVLLIPSGSGLKVASGQMVTASASDTVATGLKTVTAAIANLEDAPVIGCDRANAVIGDQAGAPVAGSILVKSYKPTAAGDATPIAATTFVKKVNWIAVGT